MHELTRHFGDGIGIGFLDGQVQQDFAVFEVPVQFGETVDIGGQQGAFFQNGRRFFGIVPKRLAGDHGLDFFQSSFLAGQVKDTP